MACPHCGCHETWMLLERECCMECNEPVSSVIRCRTCGVEIEAQDDEESGDKTVIRDCPDCFYDLVNEGE